VSDNFSWQVHADYVIGKLESAVFLMSCAFARVIARVLRILVLNYMQYGIVFWGASKAALQGVFVAQKN
jgi:hypothetical protein